MRSPQALVTAGGRRMLEYRPQARDERVVGQSVVGIGLALATVWWLWLGSDRWFFADDWSYLLIRDVFEPSRGNGAWRAMMMPLNGQPVALTAVQMSALGNVFGWDSYVPFVVANIVLQLTCLILLWRILLRIGATHTSAALVTVVVTFLGASTEFPTLAAISNYQYSLLGFLAISLILLTSTGADGSSRRWIVAAAAIGALTALASGFTLIFVVGEALLGFALRRPKATGLIVAPQIVIYAGWFVVYGRNAETGNPPANLFDVPDWTVMVIVRTFEAIGAPAFGSILLVATIGLGLVMVDRAHYRRGAMYALALTMVVALVVIGTQRAANGEDSLTVGRYIVVMAFLIAPAVSVTFDRIVASDRRLVVALAMLVASSVIANGTSWRHGQVFLAETARIDRVSLGVLAGLDLSSYPVGLPASLCSPDITIADLPELVDRQAIVVRRASRADLEVAEQILHPDDFTGYDLRPCAPKR